eukprot:scaffold270_cov390-Prasinococcus_capsulatus_cf.AAC.4
MALRYPQRGPGASPQGCHRGSDRFLIYLLLAPVRPTQVPIFDLIRAKDGALTGHNFVDLAKGPLDEYVRALAVLASAVQPAKPMNKDAASIAVVLCPASQRSPCEKGHVVSPDLLYVRVRKVHKEAHMVILQASASLQGHNKTSTQHRSGCANTGRTA